MVLVFEVSGSGTSKLKCTKCAPLIANEARQWIAAASWKAHMQSEIHQRALATEQDTLHRQTRIDRAADAALAEDCAADFTLLNASSSSVTHLMPKRIVSANEEAMWESLVMGDVFFDVGVAPDGANDRKRVEREMDDADIWGGNSLIHGLGDDSNILNDQEDEVLAEALRNAGE
jgi:hypothetical protein